MIVGVTKSSLTRDDIKKQVREEDLLAYYFGIRELPCLISSPFRKDENPSFVFFPSGDGAVLYKDLALGDTGNLFQALKTMWGTDENTMLIKINEDIKCGQLVNTVFHEKQGRHNTTQKRYKSHIDVKVRNWREYDIEYWESFGIGKTWLTYAEIFPVSHIFISNKKGQFSYPADKYAYVYIERKEGNITKKIYQPFNKAGFKWCSDNDKSVVALWTKVPKYGDKICICSSVKDALCLWSNTGIPSIAIQGEGFPMSQHAINDLKNRFNKVYILLDNDKPGIDNGIKLSMATGFINIQLPQFEGGKDISDFYKVLGNKELFKEKILILFDDLRSNV